MVIWHLSFPGSVEYSEARTTEIKKKWNPWLYLCELGHTTNGREYVILNISPQTVNCVLLFIERSISDGSRV